MKWTMYGSWGDTRFYCVSRNGMWRLSPQLDGRWKLTLAPPGLEAITEIPCGDFADREEAEAYVVERESQ